MSPVLRALLFLPLLLLTPLLGRAGLFEHTTTEELSGELSSFASIEIKNVNGPVTLRSGDTDSYHIEITKKSRSEENLERIEVRRKIDADQIWLEVHIPKKKGWFSMGQIQGSVSIVVIAPATANLREIRSINGSIDLTGFTHETHASSVNGVIRARDLSGSTELDTVNGSIRATFAGLAEDDHLKVSSVNGGIHLELPAQLNADLDTSVVNGRISCDYPITLRDGASSRKLRGRIGEGGAAVRASTVNGSIRLTEAP